MATYKEKNFIADEKPQKKRPGERNNPEHEYLNKLGSAKERVADWKERGLPDDAAYAKVAIDEIIDEIKKTDDPDKLNELQKAMYDVQMNNKNAKWIKDRKSDYYGREPDPDEYIPDDEPKYEVVNDFAIDAIKDNFTPPGAKDEEEYYEDDGGRVYTWGELKKDIDDWVKKSDFEEQFANEDERKGYFNSDSTPNYRKIYNDFWDIGSNGAMSQISKDRAKELREDIDTNNNGKIEDDELSAYTKDLEDYLDKNPDAKKKNYY